MSPDLLATVPESATRDRKQRAPAARRRVSPVRRGAVTYVWLAVAAVVMIYPLLWMLGSSFKPDAEIFADGGALLPAHWDFNNYAEGWSGVRLPFGTFFINSLFIAAAATIGNVISCSMAGYAFARLSFKIRPVLFGFMLLTMMLPMHVVLIPQYVLFHQLHMVDTFYPLFLPQFFAVDGFFVFLIVQFIRGLPTELDEAATLDGCNPGQVFLYVIVPLLKPALVTTAIFSFIWSYNNFFSQLIYLSKIQLFTVPLGLRQFVDPQMGSQYGPLFAMSTLSLIPPFLLFLFFQRWIVEGIATTGGKS